MRCRGSGGPEVVKMAYPELEPEEQVALQLAGKLDSITLNFKSIDPEGVFHVADSNGDLLGRVVELLDGRLVYVPDHEGSESFLLGRAVRSNPLSIIQDIRRFYARQLLGEKA